MSQFFECWRNAAAVLFPQALAGGPEFAECAAVPPVAGAPGYCAVIAGEVTGRFTVLLEATLLATPLLGEGVDQQSAWGELLRETAEAAAAEMLARTGRKCRVVSVDRCDTWNGEDDSHCAAFRLHSAGHVWTIVVCDAVSDTASDAVGEARRDGTVPIGESHAGVELLLDVKLDASLRFGCCELPLGEILDLGPGDVVPLDRHVSDPVDLIVGDKLVARGEVVLVNGSFGLRVTEVAAPKKRLESIRCLF